MKMKKISPLARCMIATILVALVLSSFSTFNVFAKTNAQQKIEDKWSQLVSNYNRQSLHHNSAHNWVNHWLQVNKKLTASEKEDVTTYLSVCNSAIASAGTVVAKHAGFDARGNVIDRSLAKKSIKDLAYYLRQHAGSIKNLNEHVNQ